MALPERKDDKFQIANNEVASWRSSIYTKNLHFISAEKRNCKCLPSYSGREQLTQISEGWTNDG